MNYYSRRFRLGNSRFMTRANIEDGIVVISQTERIDNTRIDNRSSVILSIPDFQKMIKQLAISPDS